MDNIRRKIYDSEVEARTDEWHQKRWAMFTASQMHKILVPGKGEMFSTGGWTYIEEKALEMTSKMWERPDVEGTESVLHGRVHEYPAFQEYVKVTGNKEVTYFGDDDPIFYPYLPLAQESGGTPDSVVIVSGMIIHGVEIKCPKNPMIHFRRLDWRTQWDIKEKYSECYAQIQFLMMCAGAKTWDFMSYDDRQRIRKMKSVIIPVKQDLNFQNNLEVRLRQAIKEKYKIISKRCGMEVTNRTEFIQKFNLAA